MATDGVKIIDSDVARDTYEGIMDLYDSGVAIETIKKEIPFIKDDFGPDADFYNEQFVTSYALAFWEIGAITNGVIEEVKHVITVGEGVRIWTEEYGETTGRKRQKELDSLLHKISQPNNKVRKRKKFRIIKNLFFLSDDVLTFRLPDNNYYAVICAKVTQQRGQCTYDLVSTTYKGKSKPNENDILNCDLAGRRIGAGSDPKTTLSLQPGVDKVWALYGANSNFFFGLAYHLVTHKDMVKMKSNFEKVGNIKLRDSFKKDGSYAYESSFERFESIFGDLDRHMKVFREERFPVRLLCEP